MIYRKKVRLGDLLVQKGIITEEQLSEALKQQKEKKLMLGEMIVSMGFASQSQINDVLCEHLNIDFVDMREEEPDPQVLSLLDESIMRKYTLVPLRHDNNNAGALQVAMADPMNILAMDDINIITGMQVVPILANAQDINAFLDKAFGQQQAQNIVELYKREQEDNNKEAEKENNARREEIENAPIVVLINNIIEQAVRQRASDIHIEPMEKTVRVRYRIDGNLKEIMKYDNALLGAITTRLKIMSGMDISEKRKPQDGRITTTVDRREYDIRVSNLPTVYGEKVVMRIASKEGFNVDISKLGLTERDRKVFQDILRNPHGIILVTGPTGSGKSTTLYTALSELNTEDVNIITVEDPVEANIDGINQVQVNTKANLTFASALRSILRQDPDIIMIGEIRDSETAEIAVRASITGHLVVSTLHTNSTASSVARLEDMGVESYLIADSMVGIIAQRLVRRLCECKKPKEATVEEKQLLGVDTDKSCTIYEPCGCKLCNNTGYYGRMGIYEIMKISPAIKRLISKNADAEDIKNQAVKEGMNTLKMAAANGVKEGITSIAEMIKATYEAEEEEKK
ncbi:MAG TPA: type II secretion system protein GspE [Eubacterium sp.]|jgi:type IV pilus assembly protein PilB|nr:type II secretion system protein GspE [Eubacterium sp.]